MKPAHLTPFARERLARHLKKWKGPAREPPPARGWVREIREALGMSAAQLGARLRMTQAAVAALEKSERLGRIKLVTLRKAARALNCELAYALVPNKALEEIAHNRRRRTAAHELRASTPPAGISAEEYRALLEAYARRIKQGRVWTQE